MVSLYRETKGFSPLGPDESGILWNENDDPRIANSPWVVPSGDVALVPIGHPVEAVYIAKHPKWDPSSSKDSVTPKHHAMDGGEVRRALALLEERKKQQPEE
ncbi:hypothetical protein LCGC14_2795480 [marine sediment metagenome]|uniref:Uncharacterized protein n=1 Tax=marine sediment metagenome TaxID=412755 RepID=A0A0F8YP65_9ZZZZ